VPGIKEFLSKAALNHCLTTALGYKSCSKGLFGGFWSESNIYIKDLAEQLKIPARH
jgi:hypothetical protein